MRAIGMRDIGTREMRESEVEQQRAAPNGNPAALVALSSFGQTQHVLQSQEASFIPHLVKPVEATHYSSSSRTRLR